MMDDLRVLIVDEDIPLSRLYAGYINAMPGFTALDPVGTATAAAAAATASNPDLILINIHLPDGNGLDLLPGLGIDAFVVIAEPEAASMRKAILRTALSYMIKPLSEKQLAERLGGYARYRRILASPHGLDQHLLERALHQIHSLECHQARPVL